MIGEMRVCDASTLLLLCGNADKHEFNRRAVTEALAEDIDHNGINVLGVIIPYHRASFGPSVEPIWPDHHRCHVYAKVKDSDEPVAFYLDVAVKDFEQLMPYQTFVDKMNDPIEMGIAHARAAANAEEGE